MFNIKLSSGTGLSDADSSEARSTQIQCNISRLNTCNTGTSKSTADYRDKIATFHTHKGSTSYTTPTDSPSPSIGTTHTDSSTESIGTTFSA